MHIQKPETEDLIFRRGNMKTFKVMKVLRVRCTPVTDISKEIVMAHNKRCLEVRNRDQD